MNGARSVSCKLFGSDLRDIRFTSCRFENCDLSLSNIGDSVIRDAVFSGCKALGVRFDHCLQFGFSVTFGARQLIFQGHEAEKNCVPGLPVK